MALLEFLPPTPVTAFMATLAWLPLSVTALCAYATARCIYLLYFHPASQFPGPIFAAISNVPYAYNWLRGRWPWAVEEMVKKYGNVVRVAPNEIVFATPQAALDLMDFGTGDGGFIWEQDPVKRREVAKKILPAFSTKAIKAKEPIVHQHIDFFIEKMKSVGGSSEGVDMNTLAMDMSADLAYNRELHQMRDGT
ncbi:hypothetical protein DL764_003532 [Monosporascus ibericus]|uniref:Cytochrome P450 n=1 Tax=Monosporascus ibericus TaxID=155417 RepID=A0A4Q4TG45_9PEZI|nr:hypothetical protein DL764_003532 [Monosporascus ibericus]